MQRAPAIDAPVSIWLDPISLSAWINIFPSSGSRQDIYSNSSDCGVIGYPQKNSSPERIAVSATASFPFITFFMSFTFLIVQPYLCISDAAAERHIPLYDRADHVWLRGRFILRSA